MSGALFTYRVERPAADDRQLVALDKEGNSPMSAPVDGTVEKTRFDGMMSQYQRALGMLSPEQRATLKTPDDSAAQPNGGNVSQDSQQPADQGPDFEEGESYTFENGQFVPVEPPTPMSHSETVSRSAPRDATESELRAKLDRQVGKPSVSHDWGDITAR
jgi:hypothetical protein